MVERSGNGDKSLENWIWDAACSIRGAQEAARMMRGMSWDVSPRE
ncbi:hypothetical protein [Nostoc sp.]